jgi:hypothetical protein
LFHEDLSYFSAADLNGDLKLSLEEFGAFQNPEHASHMHKVLMEVLKYWEEGIVAEGIFAISEYFGRERPEQGRED